MIRWPAIDGTFRAVFAVVLWLVLAWPAVAQEPAEPPSAKSLADLPIPLELQPYRVGLAIAAPEDIRHQTADALVRSVGPLWQTRIDELTGLARIEPDVLRRWTVDEFRHRSANDVDFWFAVVFDRRGSQYRLAVRAWQPRFEWLSPVHEASFYEPRETPARIVQLCWGLFRPQVLIEHVDNKNVRVRIPGGDLRAADPAFRLLQPGDCLVPWLLYYDRDKKLKRRQELPWTYIRLDAVDGPLAAGTVLSGLRTPLAGRTRGRIDKVAVAARPVYHETTLQVGVQNQPARLLAGYLLELRPKLPERPAEGDKTPPSDADVVKLLTDRLGRVRLSPDRDRTMTWIFVYSGELLLARVPFVPGSVDSLRLDVPDDSVRLQVAGELQVLEGELINLVAERNTLIAAARAAAKKNDWNRVDQLRTELNRLPGKQKFIERLSAIRVPAVNAAKAQKDRAAQVRIERMCNDAAELIDRYLDADRIRIVNEELDELKKAIQETPP
jgi:hypothetical protein